MKYIQSLLKNNQKSRRTLCLWLFLFVVISPLHLYGTNVVTSLHNDFEASQWTGVQTHYGLEESFEIKVQKIASLNQIIIQEKSDNYIKLIQLDSNYNLKESEFYTLSPALSTKLNFQREYVVYNPKKRRYDLEQHYFNKLRESLSVKKKRNTLPFDGLLYYLHSTCPRPLFEKKLTLYHPEDNHLKKAVITRKKIYRLHEFKSLLNVPDDLDINKLASKQLIIYEIEIYDFLGRRTGESYVTIFENVAPYTPLAYWGHSDTTTFKKYFQ